MITFKKQVFLLVGDEEATRLYRSAERYYKTILTRPNLRSLQGRANIKNHIGTQSQCIDFMVGWILTLQDESQGLVHAGREINHLCGTDLTENRMKLPLYASNGLVPLASIDMALAEEAKYESIESKSESEGMIHSVNERSRTLHQVSDSLISGWLVTWNELDLSILQAYADTHMGYGAWTMVGLWYPPPDVGRVRARLRAWRSRHTLTTI